MVETIRRRLARALAGHAVTRPVYAVYDWFVTNRPTVDWPGLFALGLGQIKHANLIRHELPSVQIVATCTRQGDEVRRDVRWITDRGELHEWYLGEWRQEHLIKTPADYRIMMRALEGVRVVPDDSAFHACEAGVGEDGMTIGQIAGLGCGRSPLMVLQVDWVGLEQWSLDLCQEEPAMLELLEVLHAIKLDEVRCAARGPARHIKLWENLTIETLGPAGYRRHLVPFYQQVIDILSAADKRLLVHYDGQLRVIKDDVASLDIDGIDSFTEPPEGDMTVAEARAAWPEKFLWLHPNLNWYQLPAEELAHHIRRACRDAGPSRFCLMISEDVPTNWTRSLPCVLKALGERGSID